LAEKQIPLQIVSENIDLTKSCQVEVLLCNMDPADNPTYSCPADVSLAQTTIKAEVQDGPIDIFFPINSTFIKEYESINYKRIQPVINVESAMSLYYINKTLKNNPGLDYTMIFEVTGP